MAEMLRMSREVLGVQVALPGPPAWPRPACVLWRDCVVRPGSACQLLCRDGEGLKWYVQGFVGKVVRLGWRAQVVLQRHAVKARKLLCPARRRCCLPLLCAGGGSLPADNMP